MNLYEKLFILDTTLDEKTKEDQISKVERLIVDNGGEVLKTTNLGSRKLSYAIKKQEKGEYILLIFNAPPAAIAKLERFSKLAEPILKFMIIKIEKKKHIAAVMSSLDTEPPGTEATGDDVVKSEPVTTDDVVKSEPLTTEENKEDVQ